jgi:hypothetical protein
MRGWSRWSARGCIGGFTTTTATTTATAAAARAAVEKA